MTHGMVVAPQPEAAEAGAVALMSGGNAVDAAIACAFMQTVVDPLMCGIAGFGSLNVHLPGRGVRSVIDFHGRAPAAARADIWTDLVEGQTRDGFGFILKGRVNDAGYQSVAVPGAMRAFAEAHKAWGRLPWRDLVRPAAAHAEAGFVVRPEVHRYWTQVEGLGRVETADRLRLTEASRRLYIGPDGQPRQRGSRIANPDMARSLAVIAEEGAEALHTGTLARAIDADMRAHGGLLRFDDLAGYKTVHGAPLAGSYRGIEIAANPPPGGGIMLVQMLNIIEQFDLRALGHNTPDYIRVVAEAMKWATIDKDALVGDPLFVDVPVARLTDKRYAAEIAKRIHKGEKADVPRMEAPAEAKGTTHVCVVDDEGNAVSMTHTLGSGSGVVTDGLGFMYNNAMSVFDPRPGRAFSLAPGKSRFSSMCPSILLKDGKPWLLIGAPGGTQIAPGVMQVILNVVDFGMSMAEAVAAPRFSATGNPIDVSNRIPTYVTRAVEAMGYEVIRSYQSYGFAGVHAIRVEGGSWDGAADPGRDGVALQV